MLNTPGVARAWQQRLEVHQHWLLRCATTMILLPMGMLLS